MRDPTWFEKSCQPDCLPGAKDLDYFLRTRVASQGDCDASIHDDEEAFADVSGFQDDLPAHRGNDNGGFRYVLEPEGVDCAEQWYASEKSWDGAARPSSRGGIDWMIGNVMYAHDAVHRLPPRIGGR